MLLSAGLDSAVLAAAEAQRGPVHPIYISTGLAWESDERAVLNRLLASSPYAENVERLVHLSFTVEDLYPDTHWARRGDAPGFDTPDEDVYLVGRNIVLLSKAAIYCSQHDIGRIALGPLAGNPFPDATPQFFSTMGKALSIGLGAHDCDRYALRSHAKERSHHAWLESQRAVRAHPLMHEPSAGAPLRAMQ